MDKPTDHFSENELHKDWGKRYEDKEMIPFYVRKRKLKDFDKGKEVNWKLVDDINTLI